MDLAFKCIKCIPFLLKQSNLSSVTKDGLTTRVLLLSLLFSLLLSSVGIPVVVVVIDAAAGVVVVVSAATVVGRVGSAGVVVVVGGGGVGSESVLLDVAPVVGAAVGATVATFLL